MQTHCRPRMGTALFVVLSCLPTLAKPDSAPGLVTFTFDDATRSQYTLGLPIAKELGIPGTLFVVTKNADEATLVEVEAKAQASTQANADPKAGAEDATAFAEDRWYMTWDEIRRFRDAGWEIGSHTETHPHLSEHEETRVAQEIDTARARIEAEIGTEPVSFAPPYGDFNARTLEMAMKRHRFHVVALGEVNGGRNSIEALDPSRIDRFEVNIWTESASVCGEIVNAALGNTWLVLMFHGFTEYEPSDYEVRIIELREIMECARALEDHGLIRIATVAGAMDLIEKAAGSMGPTEKANGAAAPVAVAE